jgi:hypothetical protein
MARAERGHKWVHRPQPRHRRSSIIALLSRTDIAFTRQKLFLTQVPHPLHRSDLTKMYVPGTRAYFMASSLTNAVPERPISSNGLFDILEDFTDVEPVLISLDSCSTNTQRFF